MITKLLDPTLGGDKSTNRYEKLEELRDLAYSQSDLASVARLLLEGIFLAEELGGSGMKTSPGTSRPLEPM